MIMLVISVTASNGYAIRLFWTPYSNESGKNGPPLEVQSSSLVFREALSEPGNFSSTSNRITSSSGGSAFESSPLFSRNVLVSADLGLFPFQDEPWIAINPRNPDNLIIGAHDLGIPSTMVSYASFDGGAVWKKTSIPKILKDDLGGSDPTLAFDRKGVAYYTYLSIGLLGNSIVTVNSTNGGLTWSEPVVSVKGGEINDTAHRISTRIFNDKPTVFIGADPIKSDVDNIYICFTEFADVYDISGSSRTFLYENNTIKVVRSTDGGRTFSKPVAISPESSYVTLTNTTRIFQGSAPAVSQNNIVYVSYYDSGTDGWLNGTDDLMIARSSDGGSSFSKPSLIAHARETGFNIPPTFFRVWLTLSPIIASALNGDVYAVFTSDPDGPDDADIMFCRSSDDGNTWSSPKRVNDDETLNDQFFQTINVSPNGMIHVNFGDRRDDPSDVNYHVYYTSSTDGGSTFERNIRVTEIPSNPFLGFPNGLFIGDYFGLASSANDVYVVWTDCRTGRIRSLSQHIVAARIKPIQGPTISSTTAIGPSGTTIELIGSGFSTFGRDVAINFDDVNVLTVSTNDEGGFSTKMTIPFSTSGTHTIGAIDVLGGSVSMNFAISYGLNDVGEELANASRVISETSRALEQRLGSLEKNVTDAQASLMGELANNVAEIRIVESRLNDVFYMSIIASVAAIAVSVIAMIVVLQVRRSLNRRGT